MTMQASPGSVIVVILAPRDESVDSPQQLLHTSNCLRSREYGTVTIGALDVRENCNCLLASWARCPSSLIAPSENDYTTVSGVIANRLPKRLSYKLPLRRLA